MHLSVLKHVPAGLEMLGCGGHGFANFREDAWLVHVIPGVEPISRALELVKPIHARVVIGTVFIEVVNPDGITGPAVTFEIIQTC